MRSLLLPVALFSLLSLPASLVAQNTLLFVSGESAPTLGPAATLGAVGTLRPDEIAAVTPIPGVNYFAGPLLSVSTQWVYVGDMDANGDIVESSYDAPGGRIDALFVKRNPAPTAPVGPRTVFLSKADTTGFGATQLDDGDVFRYAAQGALEFFVREPHLQTALGTTDDLDLDAICQDAAGNLCVSFADATTVGTTPIEDGAVVFIPATAITYDTAGNVTAIAADSARVLATEADVRNWILNSRVKSINGAVPDLSPATLDLTGLEMDPNGGGFAPPQIANYTLPNMLFAWNAADADGALVSTAFGGSIGVVNALFMGRNTATTGTHLGLLPNASGIGGVEGVALGPFAPGFQELALEVYPDHSITPGDPLWTRQEVIGATSFGVVVFFLDGALNGTFPTFNLPAITGSIYGAGFPLITTAVASDVHGQATASLMIPATSVGTGIAVVWQALDLNTLRVALPGAMDL